MIKAIMRQRNLRPESLASLVGVTLPTLESWLRGDTFPRGELLERLENLMSYDLFGEQFTNKKIEKKLPGTENT